MKLAPHTGHVSNLCGSNGTVIESWTSYCFQSDRCCPPTLVQTGHPVWTRLELAKGPKVTSGCVIQDLTTSDDVRHANGRLVIFSVHSQTSAINFGSRERGFDLAGLDLTKYSPETCATSGEVARYRDTAAPCFEFRSEERRVG